MIKHNMNLLLKTLYIRIPLELLLLLTIARLGMSCYSFYLNGDVLYFLQSSLELCLVSFIVLLYSSYELFYRIRYCNIEETLYYHRNGKFIIAFSSVACLFAVPVLQFLISLVFNVVIFFISGMSDFSYLLHCFSVLFLYIILGGAIPILLGILFAKKLRRVAAYSCIAITVFMVSGISDFIFGSLSQATWMNFWSIKYFLSYFLPNDLDCIVEYEYGLYCEPYRWNLTLFWIFFLLLICILAFNFKKSRYRNIALCSCLVLSIFNLAGYFQGGSHIELGDGFDGNAMSDYVYYRNNEVDKIDKKPDFQVTDYNMNFNIDRQLDAEVTMSLSDTTKSEYDFTLYHSYNILSVTDENDNELNYNRFGDYITVMNNGKFSNIKIEYKGYSPIFYSNSQACCLPGCFPYYPIAGCYDFVDDWGVYTPICNLPQADFTVNINTGKQMYSNLNESSSDKNSFEGTTSCPMLFSGFYETVQSDKYDICGSTVKSYGGVEISDEYIDDVQNFVNQEDESVSINLKDYKIIQMSDMVLNSTVNCYAFYADDVILMTGSSDDDTKQEIAHSLVQQAKMGYSEYRKVMFSESESEE